MDSENLEIESHPWPPFIPEGAKVLIMGTFPPQAKRWNMDFYYPNRTNDFWKIIGLLFLGDKDALLIPGTKDYDENKIRALLTENHIALNDTVRKARRLKGNASDKFLEVVEPVPIFDLMRQMPLCHTLATTGEKAGEILAELTRTDIPKIGEYVESTLPADLNRTSGHIEIWRMPSTSRAYPLAVEKKAEYYASLFAHLNIL